MTDNASNNTTMVSAIVDHLQNVSIVNYDADNLHVHCLAHVLNLAVQSVFSIINIHQPKAIKVGPSTSASESDVDSAGEEDGNGSEVDLFLDEEEEKAKVWTSSDVSSDRCCLVRRLVWHHPAWG